MAGADVATTEALCDYGMSLGIAFQIADDLLDFLGDAKVTGKPRCSDLREGKMTLPLIAAYRDLPKTEPRRLEVAEWVESPRELTQEQVENTCALIEEKGGFEYARRSAVRYVEDAQRKIAQVIPPSAYRDSLNALAEYALGRKM